MPNNFEHNTFFIFSKTEIERHSLIPQILSLHFYFYAQVLRLGVKKSPSVYLENVKFVFFSPANLRESTGRFLRH